MNTDNNQDSEVKDIKHLSEVATRRLSRRLDEINSHINSIDVALESVIEISQKALEDEHDVVALITMYRIAKKYNKMFAVWQRFLNEDIEMLIKITEKFTDFDDEEIDKLAE